MSRLPSLVVSPSFNMSSHQRTVARSHEICLLDHLDEYPYLTAACEIASKRLGFGAESLRRWVSSHMPLGAHDRLADDTPR